MGRRHKPKKLYNVGCPYCGHLCPRVGGDVIYPHRPDLKAKLFYWCQPCDAYVGTHQRSGEPLGLPANRQLRHARIQAHDAFDPLWKNGVMSRDKAYLWLAYQLGVKLKEAHIGRFNIEECRKLIAAVAKFRGVSVKYGGSSRDAEETGGLVGSDREPDADGEDAHGAGAA